MLFRHFFATIFVCLALPAAAEFQTVSRAYEIPLDHFSAPASLNAMTTFRQCDTCVSHNVRVTASTEYRVNEEIVTLQEFRMSIFNVQNRSEETVIVLHHLASDTVEQVLIVL